MSRKGCSKYVQSLKEYLSNQLSKLKHFFEIRSEKGGEAVFESQDLIFDSKIKPVSLLQPAYFAPSFFCKEGLWKDENVFFWKKNTFFILFSNFSNFQNFLIFAKKPHN